MENNWWNKTWFLEWFIKVDRDASTVLAVEKVTQLRREASLQTSQMHKEKLWNLSLNKFDNLDKVDSFLQNIQDVWDISRSLCEGNWCGTAKLSTRKTIHSDGSVGRCHSGTHPVFSINTIYYKCKQNIV